MDSYVFCTVGGIICKLCSSSLACYNGYVYEIAKHEKHNKNHLEALDRTARRSVVDNFKKYIDKLATEVLAAMPNEDEARRIISSTFTDGELQQYRYCTVCDIPIVNAKIHIRGKHFKECAGRCEGYKSNYWTKKQPKNFNGELFAIC